MTNTENRTENHLTAAQARQLAEDVRASWNDPNLATTDPMELAQKVDGGWELTYANGRTVFFTDDES